MSNGIAAHFQRRIDGFQSQRRLCIERVKLLWSASPEQSIRFIPEFPVADVVVEPVRPALVVMHRNMLGHVGKLIEVSRRSHIGAPTASHAVINLRPACTNRGQHFIGRTKIVAFRLFRIGVRIRKEDASVARLHNSGALRGIWNQIGQVFVCVLEF